ncbi:hypothetical protein PC129_g10830 [Phytophthora cactorum]|uniref:PX domain-containing protein n=1 Tax=Phytophthora cactorum TaxID=29920 RepID=A0A329SPD0_9STRA|nr:hypothetical protein Pcac1_g14580 [Phytophthora cactorum]KAG2820191.1 hypothetical protein PC112_g11863 [Phytophthora cactorum]KAG2822982.1 hypothetical protein PC111_g10421 [Phytophthora cactorum]KAG2855869.1 hypothetical protein PC113_g12070 [Phytophthora cactorum]KAG2903465.1 hypothetical protein PC114_g12262 [Phytophthora cactorum]
MREIDARVTGFDYTTFHAYTTEVEVDGRTWTLAIRYNTFYQFYTRLTALEKHFTVEFPPKGGLFFSPPPEERQEQLDDFLLSTLAYFDMRGHPKRMEALLGELLQIPEHMGYKDDDEERTASEGSSVTDELLLDTPMPGNDHDDFLESGHEEDVQEDKITAQILENNVEVVQEVTKELKAEVVKGETKPEAVETELGESPEADEVKPEVAAKAISSPNSEVKASPVKQRSSQELTGGDVAKDYIAMLRRKTLVDGAIQAAVVSMMKENVEKSVKVVTTDAPAPEVILVEKEKPAALEKPAVQTENVATKTGMEPAVVDTTVSALEVSECILPAPEEGVVEALAPATTASAESPIESDLTETQEDTATLEPAEATTSETEETESEAAVLVESDQENPVVSWFRRMGTFGPSAVEKEQQDATAKKEQEDKEAAIRAKTKAQEEAAAEAKAKREAEAKEAAETELQRAEQELNLRLMPYRHPVFFQEFNCDVGTSRYSLPQRPSEGTAV